jgi:NAD(P)-dependent dehydrogenase (short-subunit alcohol dehydrogenase family)
MNNLKNKVIILTGGLGLIGKGLTYYLAKNDARVIILDIKSFKDINKIKNFNKIKNKIFYFKCDVTNLKSIKKVLPKILKISKKIDVLINNAAINDSVENKSKVNLSKFENFPLDYWNKTVKANLNSLFLCSQVFGKEMVKYKNGSIINIASTYGVVGPDQKIYMNKKSKNIFYKNPAYPTTKGGVISFTKYLASYWGKDRIRVNCISPGGIENNQNKIFIKKYISKTLLGRMAKIEDLFGAIKLLCSQDSSYITGTNIIVDGGWTTI